MTTNLKGRNRDVRGSACVQTIQEGFILVIPFTSYIFRLSFDGKNSTVLSVTYIINKPWKALGVILIILLDICEPQTDPLD